jgi:hypothetical protein
MFPILSMISCKNTNHSAYNHNIVDTTLKILIYGLQDREQLRAMDTMASKYGLRFYAVAGCVISKLLLDSLNKQNKKVYTVLEQRFGRNWKLTFSTEVDSMRNLQKQVEVLLKKEARLLDKENDQFNY